MFRSCAIHYSETLRNHSPNYNDKMPNLLHALCSVNLATRKWAHIRPFIQLWPHCMQNKAHTMHHVAYDSLHPGRQNVQALNFFSTALDLRMELTAAALSSFLQARL